jgi:hypothetical protein
MCVRDSYVYQKGVLCSLIHESYVRSVGRCCFVRNYAAVPVQLEVFILQCIGWCVLAVWTSVFNQFNYYYYYYYYYYYCYSLYFNSSLFTC